MGLFRRSVADRIVTLPPRGKALIVSDLHGHAGDWEEFLYASRAVERLTAGDDLWVLITGDVPDVLRHRAVDPSVPEDGDATILDRIMSLKTELGARGERVVYLEGNHDFHLARLAREVVRYHATRRGERTSNDTPPRYTDAERKGYCGWYLETYGEVVYQNNVAPYDMLERLRPEHVTFLESTPVMAVCATAGLVVTHAGPPRMSGWRAAALKKAISRADRESLRRAPAEEYYASPYHQLLNNRFRNGDYDLSDVREFMNLWTGGGGLLVTGHTPHPYLVDFERRAPLADCSFQDGLGMVGEHQVVLCTSFGAFSPAQKRWLEVDLSLPHATAAALFQQREVRALYSPNRCPALRPLPGAELIVEDSANQARMEHEMARTRTISSADTVDDGDDDTGPMPG